MACRRRGALAAIAMLLAVPGIARAADPLSAVQGPQYAVQLGTSVQQDSNPARLPDSYNGIRSSPAVTDTLGAGLRLPLLSEDTRLDVAGSVGDVRYGSAHQIDYQPRYVNSTLYWRAGPLFTGRFDYDYTSALSDALDRTWPLRDLESHQQTSAELSFHAAARLELPVLQVFRNTVRYTQPLNGTLYSSNESGWQVSARYYGSGNSFLQAGLRHANDTFPWRTPEQVAQVDAAAIDNELFVLAQWDYSPKTWIEARAGLLRHDYAHLTERDTDLATFEFRGLWTFSPKTRFDFRLWRRPYADDDDPTVLYSTLTGGSAAVTWQPSPRTSVSLLYQRSIEHNTTVTAAGAENLILASYGVRLQWQQRDNLRWVFDVYRDRQLGQSLQDSYTQNFVRIGLQYTFGSKHDQPVRAMLKPAVCQWSYSAQDLC